MLGSGLIGRAFDATGGSLRMVQAGLEDLAGALGVADSTVPDDWFDARDPEYIRQTLPALRAWSDYYFRAEVSGLEHIPEDEAALLVGNHSGGTLIADTFVFSQHFYDHFG